MRLWKRGFCKMNILTKSPMWDGCFDMNIIFKMKQINLVLQHTAVRNDKPGSSHPVSCHRHMLNWDLQELVASSTSCSGYFEHRRSERCGYRIPLTDSSVNISFSICHYSRLRSLPVHHRVCSTILHLRLTTNCKIFKNWLYNYKKRGFKSQMGLQKCTRNCTLLRKCNNKYNV